MTTLDQAIELLTSLKEDYPGDTPVYLSKDAEGNRFRPMDSEFSPVVNDGGVEIRPFDEDEDDEEEIIGIALWPL